MSYLKLQYADGMALIHQPAVLASFGYSAILTVVQIWAIISHRRDFRRLKLRLDEMSAEISASLDALESISTLKKIA